MFSREVRLAEAMKRIITAMWQYGAPPSTTGYTANDVIIGLESGKIRFSTGGVMFFGGVGGASVRCSAPFCSGFTCLVFALCLFKSHFLY